MKQIIQGTIAGCSPLEQYNKRNGEPSVKCVIHVKGYDNGHEKPQELAVSLSGDFSKWAGRIGAAVEVEYVNRVFPFKRGDMDWFGNDVYAVNIKEL